MAKRIMVVDDEEMIEELIEQRLEKWGYEHISFTDSNEALPYFNENHANIDLVIIDLTMPGLDGVQIAEMMCQIAPDIPIILTTGALNTELPDKDINKVLFKPISKEALLNTITELIGKAPTDNP